MHPARHSRSDNHWTCPSGPCRRGVGRHELAASAPSAATRLMTATNAAMAANFAMSRRSPMMTAHPSPPFVAASRRACDGCLPSRPRRAHSAGTLHKAAAAAVGRGNAPEPGRAVPDSTCTGRTGSILVYATTETRRRAGSVPNGARRGIRFSVDRPHRIDDARGRASVARALASQRERQRGL